MEEGRRDYYTMFIYYIKKAVEENITHERESLYILKLLGGSSRRRGAERG